MGHFLCLAIGLLLLCIILKMGMETYGTVGKAVIPQKLKMPQKMMEKGYEGNIVTFWGVDPNQLQIAGSGKQY